MIRTFLAAGALALVAPALADDSSALSYLYLNASYDRHQERDSGLVADGFSLGGSVDLAEHVFLQAGYSSSQTEEFESNGVRGHVADRALSAGLGVHGSISPRADVLASLGWIRIDSQGYEGFAGDEYERQEGVTGYLGARYLPTDWLEFSAGPGYSVIGREPGWDASVGMGVAAADTLWFDATYWVAEGMDGWSLGLRTTLGGGENEDEDDDASDDWDDEE